MIDGAEYALKRVPLTASAKGDARVGLMAEVRATRKLLQEVALLSGLEHKNIVRYYNAWIEGGDLDESKGLDGDGDGDEGSWSESSGVSADVTGGSNRDSASNTTGPGAAVKDRESLLMLRCHVCRATYGKTSEL